MGTRTWLGRLKTVSLSVIITLAGIILLGPYSILAQPPVRAFVVPYYGGTSKQGVVSTAMTGTTSTSTIAGTAGRYLYITSCQFSNDHATVDTTMLLQDGSGGTTLWKGLVVHGGGSNPVWFGAPLKVTTAGNGLFVVNVTTGSSTYVSCYGFSSDSNF